MKIRTYPPLLKQIALRIKYLLLTLFLFLLIRHPHTMNSPAVLPGLDPSYVYALNWAAANHLIFGKDIFLAGPGPTLYLFYPNNLGNNLLISYLFLFCCLFVLGLALCPLLKRIRLLRFFLFCGSFLILIYLPNQYQDYTVLYFIMLLNAVCLLKRNLAVFLLPFCAAVATFLFFQKSPLGLSAYSMTALCALLAFQRDKRSFYLVLLYCGIACAFSFAIIFWTHFQQWPYFLAWLRAARENSLGYSAAMSFQGHPSVTACALLYSAVYLMLCFCFRKGRTPFQKLLLCFAPSLFFVFKHGFVRQDMHMLIFFKYILVCAAVLFLTAKSRKEVVISLFLTVFFSGGAVQNWQSTTYCSPTQELRLGLSLPRHWNKMVLFTHPRQLQAEINAFGRKHLASQLLPLEWRNFLQQSGAAVNSAPIELTYCHANELKCTFSPMLQFYLTYTAYQDTLQARYYSASQAPRFVLLEYSGFDQRYPLWDSPASWQELLHSYETIRYDEKFPAMLLEKQTIVPARKSSIGTQIWNNEEEMLIPGSEKLLFMKLDMRLTLWGKIREFLFRIPQVLLEVEFADGGKKDFRFIPSLAQNGLLINVLPQDRHQLKDLFDGKALPQIKRVRMIGPGKQFFKKEIRVEWIA